MEQQVKNASLLIVSISICLLVAEVAFRLTGYAPRQLVPNAFFVEGVDTTWSVPDDMLGWINKQGVSKSIEAGGAQMTFWSHGRRATRPTDLPRPSGTPVMVVGGSNAQSYGVQDQDSFPYLLSESYAAYWIENFGNGGFGTAQTLLLMERVLEDFYDDSLPELVIVTFSDSHMARNVSDQSWVYSISDSEGRFVSPPHFRLHGDTLSFRPFETISLWPLESVSALVATLHHIWLQSFAYANLDEGEEVTKRLFERIANLVGSTGGQLLVVVLEDYDQIADNLFADADFPVLNCSGFERTDPQNYLLGGGSHPNPLFHQHYAACIGAWLGDNFLVSQQVRTK